MQSPRLACVLFPDLHCWERHTFEAVIDGLRARGPVSVIEVGPGFPESGRELKLSGAQRVWVIARNWRRAARRVSRHLPYGARLSVSALGMRPRLSSLPGLFWDSLRPGGAERYQVIAHSPLAYRFFRELEGIADTRLSFLPLPFSESLSPAVRDFPPRALTVGALGPFSTETGFHFALNVAHYLVQRKPGLKFRLIGSGRLKGHLTTTARELGLEKSVEIVEPGEKWDGLELDLLLYTPLRNEHHIPLLIAAAAGVPVICSEMHGIDELIQDGHDGFVLPVNETRPTGELALRLLGDPALRRFFGERLRAKLSRELSMASLAEKYEAHFFAPETIAKVKAA